MFNDSNFPNSYCCFFIYAFYQRAVYKNRYEIATELINNNKYIESIEILSSMHGYKDSSYKILEAKYNLAIQYYQNGDYENAKPLFSELSDNFDSKIYITN